MVECASAKTPFGEGLPGEEEGREGGGRGRDRSGVIENNTMGKKNSLVSILLFFKKRQDVRARNRF